MAEQKFKMVVTNLGRAKLAAAIANGTTLNLAQMSIGDGAGVEVQPSAEQTGLVRECYRADINRLETDPQNPAYCIAELVIPTTVGGWTVREIGVFDNSGALIAVGNCGDTYKPVATEGSTREMVIRTILEVGNADAVNLTIDASVVLATRQYVDDLTALSHLIPGGNSGNVLCKKSNQDGDVEWKNLSAGISLTVDAHEERQDLSAGQTVIALNTLTTGGLAVFINGIRIPKDSGWTIADATHLTLTTQATAGQKFLAVQNEPASALGFLQKDLSLADVPNKTAARANLGLGDAAIQTIAQLKTAIGSALMPVGFIFGTTNPANPAGYYGFGTWEQYAPGRTLIGFHANDSDFNAVGKTGGAKAFVLTISQLPPHLHSISSLTGIASAAGATAVSTTPTQITTSDDGGHAHDFRRYNSRDDFTGDTNGISDNWVGSFTGYRNNTGDTNQWFRPESNANSDGNGKAHPMRINPAGIHRHTVQIPALSFNISSHTHTVTIGAFNTQPTGAGTAVTHITPYTVVYFWRRTA